MKKALVVLSILGLAFLFSSCSQESAAPALTGTWRLQSSAINLEFMGVGSLTYLSFDDARPVAHAYGREPNIALKGCTHTLVDVRRELLVFWPDDTVGYLSSLAQAQPEPQGLGFAFQYEVDGNTLTLADSEGRTAVFNKVAEVPAPERCELLEATSSRPLSLPVNRAIGSNLLSDGSQLWVVGEDGKAYPIDPATGSVGAGQTLTGSFRHAVTMQGGDFWAHCRCGHNEEIRRVSLGGAVADTINTDADLGNKINIRAGSWDGSRLWLWGRNYDSDRRELLLVNSDAEPDVLEDVLVFDTWTLRQFTHHDGKLWGLFHFAGWQLAELDPAAGRVTKSYVLPALEMGGDYLGIASLDGKLYLLARLDQDYAIYTFQP
ncbi:MAG TPA: hypothetical protein ENK37_00465 [Oceanithermus profundus]|uniref:Lipoprotein n=1 Tax=Oceanithermus profundus TaxID=187137 RepID=A0A7C4ZFW8_9DEIN|nr:hypothetical protein [Oceanithermus profundus]